MPFRRALALTLLVLSPLSAGCTTVGALVGGMAESARRSGTSEVDAEYKGLAGKSFAVIVAADRIIQADFPDAVARLSTAIADRLRQNAGASGFVPGEQVLQWQYNNPRWSAMPVAQLAQELQVERLVYVDLIEYRLNDPGNAYLWSGLATANVGVIEADSSIPDDFAYQAQLTVRFPDEEGMGPAELPLAAVNTELARRMTDRVSWLFYKHEEPNELEY